VNNLKQIALAFENYNDAYGHFPTPAAPTANGRPGPRNLSWRVAILPYIEYENLYQQFNLDERWDGPTNSRLLKRMPRIYRSPGDPDDSTTTRYRVFVGGGAMFDWDRPTKVFDVKDGLSNTLMVVEAAEAVPWTKPDELEFRRSGLLPKLGRKPGKCLVATGDAQVRLIDPDDIGDTGMKALITRDGSEPIPSNW
jgi:hypothetical protein